MLFKEQQSSDDIGQLYLETLNRLCIFHILIFLHLENCDATWKEYRIEFWNLSPSCQLNWQQTFLLDSQKTITMVKPTTQWLWQIYIEVTIITIGVNTIMEKIWETGGKNMGKWQLMLLASKLNETLMQQDIS